MVWSPPTSNDFFTRFPEFEEHDVDHVDTVLDESIAEVGDLWIEADRTNAVLYRTAHFVSSGGETSSETGQPIDSETGAYIKSRTVGDVSTSYGKEGSSKSSGSSGGSSGNSIYETSWYGQQFLILMRRSFPEAIMLVV